MRAARFDEILLQGQFLGAVDARRSVQGFELAEIVPTVPEDAVRQHAHADAHFVLLLEGQYVSSARGAAAVCQAPTLIYNPPGTAHRDRFRGRGGRFVTVSVSAPALREFRAAVRLPDDACTVGRRCLGTALRIADALAVDSAASSLELESLCVELLAAAVPVDAIEGRVPPAWLWHSRELLHDRCRSEIHLSELAAAAGVHSVHLTRSFRRHFRCTPGEYLRRCRLSKAAALLSSSRLSLSKIAVACGYFDQAHFSRSFKRAYGVSPRTYRTSVFG
jgi:AraC family transcriptional regulator